MSPVRDWRKQLVVVADQMNMARPFVPLRIPLSVRLCELPRKSVTQVAWFYVAALLLVGLLYQAIP